MVDVVIRKKNEVYAEIECNDGIHKELWEEYSFYAQNYKYHPLVKARRWDGKIRLYNHKKHQLYLGLVFHLKNKLDNMGYSFQDCTGEEINIDPEDIVDFCEKLNPTSGGKIIKHHDYQQAATYIAAKHKRRVIISPTASGKSLIIYSIVRYLLDKIQGKILLLESKINLTKQILSDFEDYAEFQEFNPSEICHRISGGEEKNSHKKVYISTFQSIVKLDDEYFKQFDAIIIDEVHEAKSKGFVSILEKCVNAEYRIGLTGTLDGWEINELTIQGLLGKISKVATTHMLMERGDIAKLDIKFYELQYPKEIKKELKLETYEDEYEWLLSYKRRNHFILQLSNYLEGNILILFDYIEKQGDVLYDLIVKNTTKKVYYVHGGVDVDERERIRKEVESNNNCIILASRVFVTGTNIKRINHIILALPQKSVVKLLQSIGRGLRLAEGKDSCVTHDLCDNLIKKKKENFTLKHGLKRLEIYNNQKFNYEIIKVNL